HFLDPAVRLRKLFLRSRHVLDRAMLGHDLATVEVVQRLGPALVDLVLRRNHAADATVAVVLAVDVAAHRDQRALRVAVFVRVGRLPRLFEEAGTAEDGVMPLAALAVVVLAYTDAAPLAIGPGRIARPVIERIAGPLAVVNG